ncbi:unnamed protein product, partial [Pylaiella littoralis]
AVLLSSKGTRSAPKEEQPMEPYAREHAGTFQLSALSEEKSTGVGITGASAPSRALLGLKALYAAVDANRRERVGRTAERNNSSSSSSAISPDDPDDAGGRGVAVGRERRTTRTQTAENRGMGGDEGGGGFCGGGGGGDWRSLPLASQPSPSPRVSDESFTAMPLLGHRYRYVSTIGTGRFSDVIRSKDTFRPGRSVAVKVMNLGCGAIGIREVRFMRFLNSVPHSEFRPVVRLLDALTYQGHYCLVTELFDGTLFYASVGGDAGSRKDSSGAAVLTPATTPNYGSLDTTPFRRLPSRVFVQGTRDKNKVIFQRPGFPAGSVCRPGTTGWGGDGLGGAGASTSSPSSCSRAGTSTAERRWGKTSPGCPTHVVRHVALQLVSALLLLHNHGFIHADIKPQNVLLRVKERWRERDAAGGAWRDPSPQRVRLQDFMFGQAHEGGVESLTVKLCDFGNAIHKSEAYLYYGDFEIQTLAYRAPEARRYRIMGASCTKRTAVLMGCPFGPAVDTWSVGVILLELLLGRPLFDTARSRAGLLQQTMCAFGPMPLRRFRVGHYFSEYFPQDQSLQQLGTSTFSNTDTHIRMGCCSCCWIGDRVPLHGDARGRQANFPAHRNSCDGCCARRCRLPEVHSRGSTPFSARGSRRGLGSSSSTGCSNRRVAHAHLSRLVGAAGAASSPACSTHDVAQHYEEDGISSASDQHDCRDNAHACKPRPRRFGPGTSSIARQNPRLLSLLAGLLCYDPNERLTPLQALAHPFFGEVLPFAAVPQTTTTPAVSQTAAEPTTPAGATRARPIAPVGLSPPRTDVSPSLRYDSSVDINGRHARRETVTSRTPCRQNGGKNKSLKISGDPTAAAAAAAARLAVPSCTKVSVSYSRSPTMPSCAAKSDTANREVDPTLHLRRLAEMAEAIVRKDCDRDTRARDGGAGAGGSGSGSGSDTVRTAVTLPSPRRNPFLNAALLARLKDEQQSASTGTLKVSRTTTGEQQRQQKQASYRLSESPSAPSIVARATTTPARQPRPNRFLTPATLAMLNPDMEEREAREAAAEWLGWGAGRKRLAAAAAPPPPPATTKRPSKRATPSPEGKKCSLRTTSARTPRTQVVKPNHMQEKGRVETGIGGEEEKDTEDSAPCERQRGPGTIGRKRSRRSATGNWTRATGSGSQGATPSRERRGERTTTPRRAAVAAGVALLRIRDDESSDGSFTL